MARLGITEAFEIYGATLRNPQWSVSSWTPSGELVVSLWDHHCRRGPPGTIEFSGNLARWSGPGNTEFRANVRKAHSERSRVRLVVVKTNDTSWIDAGEDASKVKKEFFVREELIGQVTALSAEAYVFEFRKAPAKLP